MQAWWAEEASLKTLKILLFKNFWLVVLIKWNNTVKMSLSCVKFQSFSQSKLTSSPMRNSRMGFRQILFLCTLFPEFQLICVFQCIWCHKDWPSEWICKHKKKKALFFKAVFTEFTSTVKLGAVCTLMLIKTLYTTSERTYKGSYTISW